MHYRAFTHSGDVISGKGGATVAIRMLPDSPVAIVSTAYCNSNDNFSRRLGRAISAGRIDSYLAGRGTANVTEIHVPDDLELKEAVHQWISEEMENRGLSAP
jgi:hypothetical protein